jgi:Holliday junction resolvasome RuvABC endonuclease subunit
MGFDSGIANFGWAVIEEEVVEGLKPVVKYGTIRTIKSFEYRERMYHIVQEVVPLIYRYNPQAVCLEQIMLRVVSKPVMYAFAVAQLVIHELLEYNYEQKEMHEPEIRIEEVNPMELKKWFCKNAKADKQEMIETVKIKFSIKGKINEHEADAVALAAYSMNH